MSVFEVIGPIFRAVTNATGTTCFNADYYPFGQEIDHDTSCMPTYKFTGYDFDSETGNYYAYARYYSPRLGRFMSPDPLGGDILNPQSLNRYSYVLNDPTSSVDPLGLVNVPGYDQLMAESLSINGLGGGGGCIADSVYTPCGMVGDWVNSGAAGLCPTSDCNSTHNRLPLIYGPGGFNYMQHPRNLQFVCDGQSPKDCSLTQDWLVSEGSAGQLIFPLDLCGDTYIGTPEDQQIHDLANAVVAKAGYLTDWQFWAEAGGISTAAGGAAALAGDLAVGPWDSLLFGRGGSLYGGLLNSNEWLRIGFGWNALLQQNVFRIGGAALGWFMENPHIDLWPPSAWW